MRSCGVVPKMPRKLRETKCIEAAQKLYDKLIDAWTGIRVSYFLIDLRGKVTQLDLPDGQTATLER